MTLPVEVNPLLMSGSAYQIQKSLRFRASATAYLNRTPSVAGNSSAFTFSFCAKRGALGATEYLFDAFQNSTNRFYITFLSDDTMQINQIVAGSSTLNFQTTAVFRDCSSWYHFVVSINSAASGTQKCRLWVNGVENTVWTVSLISGFTTATWNTTNPHNICQYGGGGANSFDGYFAEVNVLDGTAVTDASSFGQYNSTTGVWQVKQYTGIYGTNGFYLPFTNTTSTATLGNDFSGNGNNWTVNNISLMAGSTYDSMYDVPPVYGATSGTQPVGNYATLNPISNFGSGAISNANLSFTGVNSAWNSAAGTVFAASGKWYFEAILSSSSVSAMYGVISTSFPASGFSSYIGSSAFGWALQSTVSTGTGKWNNNTPTNLDAIAQAANDVYMVAFDVDAGKIWFGKNGTWYGSGNPANGTNAAYSNLIGQISPAVSSNSSGDVVSLNCGQQPFQYTPPAGYRALCSTNIPTPTIVNGASYMDATLYTGTGAVATINNGTGSGNNPLGKTFQPDLVWIKSRSAATNNNLFDSVRGATNYLISNSQNAQSTNANSLTAFNSSGFTLGSDAGSVGVNISGNTYVGWQWNAAGGTTASNTSGTITSTVCANPSTGFSVVTWPFNTANSTVGHGLGASPQFIIIKNSVFAGSDWMVWHTALNAASGQYLNLNSTAATATFASVWGGVNPTSTTFGQGIGVSGNNGDTFVGYCWSAISGFSSFGSFTGNGSNSGPFVYTGFRPRWILVKATVTPGAGWLLIDTSTSPYNTPLAYLAPNFSDAEGTGGWLNIFSNGFRIITSSPSINASGDTVIYCAFAENPFQYALAR